MGSLDSCPTVGAGLSSFSLSAAPADSMLESFGAALERGVYMFDVDASLEASLFSLDVCMLGVCWDGDEGPDEEDFDALLSDGYIVSLSFRFSFFWPPKLGAFSRAAALSGLS